MGRWYFSKPKYDSVRTIDIHSTLCEALARERERQEKARAYHAHSYHQLYLGPNRSIASEGTQKLDLILVREDGSYINPRVMQHTSMIIHKKLGIKNFTYHSLRHTHATMLAEQDAPIIYVKERLGHKNIQVTLQYYQHLTPKISQKGNVTLDALCMNFGKYA